MALFRLKKLFSDRKVSRYDSAPTIHSRTAIFEFALWARKIIILGALAAQFHEKCGLALVTPDFACAQESVAPIAPSEEESSQEPGRPGPRPNLSKFSSLRKWTDPLPPFRQPQSQLNHNIPLIVELSELILKADDFAINNLGYPDQDSNGIPDYREIYAFGYNDCTTVSACFDNILEEMVGAGKLNPRQGLGSGQIRDPEMHHAWNWINGIGPVDITPMGSGGAFVAGGPWPGPDAQFFYRGFPDPLETQWPGYNGRIWWPGDAGIGHEGQYSVYAYFPDPVKPWESSSDTCGSYPGRPSGPTRVQGPSQAPWW